MDFLPSRVEQRVMVKIPVYLGLDYHKDAIQVCALNDQGVVVFNGSIPNSVEGLIQLASKRGWLVQRIGIEACSGSADFSDELVLSTGWSLNLAHPGYVRRMKQNPDKTDYSDARLLADLTRVGYLPKVWLAPQEIRDLRRVVRFRQDLVRQRTATKLRIMSLLREHRVVIAGTRWTKKWLKTLENLAGLPQGTRFILDSHLEGLTGVIDQIAKVEARLEKMTAGDELVARLMKQRGVGEVTAWTIRAEIGRFDRFNTGKQLARFCGLSPRNASSGNRQADAGMIKAGNPGLRTTLIEVAHRLTRYDVRWAAFKAKQRQAGKPGSVIAAAVANRWVRWLFHQMQPAAWEEAA
jgi:transposase